MNAGSAARARRGIQRRGHKVSFRRMTNTLPQTVAGRGDVFAVVEGYGPGELVNGITSGTRHLIVSLLDLQDAGFPMPVMKGDRIYLGPALDIPTTIKTIDPDHREYNGCLDIVTEGA